MVVEKKDREKITVSFSAKVGSKGLNRIKSYIEFIELSNSMPRKKISQSVINKLADEVTASAWQRLAKERGLKFE